MRREVVHEEKRRDDKFQGLKRRVTALARLDGELVHLAEGVFVVRASGVKDPRAIVERLRAEGELDLPTLQQAVKLDALPIAVDVHTIAAAHRDVRALSQRPALDLARERRRALARYGTIDEDWLRKKHARIEHAASLLNASDDASIFGADRWFDRVIDLVRAIRGGREASRLAEAGARVVAHAAERRKEARERVAILAGALDGGAPPEASLAAGRPADEASELAGLLERLDAARDLPGRARRRRVLDVLRHAVRWPGAPVDLLKPELGAHEVSTDYAALVRGSGEAMAASLPVVRDASLRTQSLELLAHLGLLFTIGDEGVPFLDESEVSALGARLSDVTDLAASGLTLARALALSKIGMKRATRMTVARWVKEGLELELVAEAAEKKHVEQLASVPDVRAARAYATWATRLSAHYASRGISFSLSPELFTNLPRNEDLAVLAMCLMEHVDPKSDAKAAPADPIAVLDATLALFQKLPAKAKGILGSLRGTEPGEGRRLFPDFAKWLDDDALLDRLVHVARLANEPPLSSAIREDFEHAERTRGERAHLEKLAARSAPQQGRLDALLRAERTLAGSPKGRTRRRISERIEHLLPGAYRRELDGTFREILREAWGIDVPSLTPAWRDAVRFWLVVDDNRALLGRLLREASTAPGRDVKHAFPKNAEWISAARSRMNVDAWLAPRRRDIVVPKSGAEQKSTRFVLAIEEDPLEVLRMGIPFGTCLALESGCNAASTVLNAIEANKRVLYVRNANGSVVARKLLAISKTANLIGYNLYIAVSGAEEAAIRAAVLETCREIGRDAGVELAATGEPAQLHRGFWYDDGTVPFDEDVDVAAYCKSLGLPPPPKWYEDLGKEARAWRACERGDVEAAIANLATYDSGPANRNTGTWVIDRLGLRAATKRAADDSSVFVALVRTLADEGEYGMLRALDLMTRVPEWLTHHRVDHLLSRFPPSPKLGVALVDLGLRAMKRHPKPTDHGLAHLTLSEIPQVLDDVASALDVLDSVDPVWKHVERMLPGCKDCVERALARAANVVEAIYDRAPDPDVVVGALMSRHRNMPAWRAALRIAARHRLPDGERAMARFLVLHPEATSTPEAIAACVRQTGTARLPYDLARRLGAPDAPPFEPLRDLLLTCEDIESILGEWAEVEDVATWSPGPWELAWRRRRRDEALHEALFERAARVPRVLTRAMELLALLGDRERIGRLEHVEVDDDARGAPARAAAIIEEDKALCHDTALACRRTATLLTEQVEATRRGRLDPSLLDASVVDAWLAEQARRVLVDERADAPSREAARAIVLRCNDGTVVDWRRLLAHAARNGDEPTAARILEEKIQGHRPLLPAQVVDLWQLPGLRDVLARTIARTSRSTFSARVWAAEREATARGLSVEGLLEKVALAIVVASEHDEAIEVNTTDQLRSILGALAREATPADLALVYDALEDTFSVAMFLRAMQRQPLPRITELREAVKKLDLSTDRGKALVAWLEVMRPPKPSLRNDGRSSIERM